MKKLFKPANIAFYILMLLSCFIIGLYVAGAIGAGKNQGLAGGAIVVGYGVLFGGVGFIASFFITYSANLKTIIKINWILLLIVVTSFGYTYYKFSQRDKKQKEENEKFKPEPTKPSEETQPLGLVMLSNKTQEISVEKTNSHNELSMGLFAPNFYENKTLYFYEDINIDKPVNEHFPYDSITFQFNKYEQIEIATAPPWLVPKHLKLDYGFLYFTVKSVSKDFIEIIGNEQKQQSTFVDRYAGKMSYWPDFLLNINSVEFITEKEQKIYARPFMNASIISLSFEFMIPIKIKNQWMYVSLVDNNYHEIDKGWIKWRMNDKILIRYSLLS